jgi:hypothetical protein
MQTRIYSSDDTAMMSRVTLLLKRVTLSCLDKEFKIIIETDKVSGQRVFIQISYESKCTKTDKLDTWKGRKCYLSKHMTDDEIIKTAYVAFEAAVKHEVMEGFKVDGIVLFNPHLNFEELLKISHLEVKRL